MTMAVELDRESTRSPLLLPLKQLLILFNLELSGLPSISELNRVAKNWRSNGVGPRFDDADLCDLSECYYEVFVSQAGVVPTRRDNWHDVFNALCWMLFPTTKGRINQWHCDEIAQFGLHPRTPKRNRLTHFDECGLVLAIPENKLDEGNEILSQLALHKWQNSFVDNKMHWGQTLLPFVFGHALYEMLMNPYIGLTGKWLAVVVDAGFEALPIQQQYQQLDKYLSQRLIAFNGLDQKAILKPLPLLGIPGWYDGQSTAFYDNKDYFRPLASHAPATEQLPLKKAL